MNNPVLYIIKRDGVQEPFTPSKIENAILKAYVASEMCIRDRLWVLTYILEVRTSTAKRNLSVLTLRQVSTSSHGQ